MKQSTLAALGSPLAIRFSNNSGGVSATSTPPGITLILQQQTQQMKPGVLRPVSLVPHHEHQINGAGSVGGNGGQVLIRRFPNNNVVHVRRVVSQQQQQQQQLKNVVVQQESSAGEQHTVLGTNATSTSNSVVTSIIQRQPFVAVTTGGERAGDLATSSEADEADEFCDKKKFPTSVSYQNQRINRSSFNNRSSKQAVELDDGGNESEDDKATACSSYNKLLLSGKRKRVADDDINEDDNEGDLLIDQVNDEEDQEGDVIEDDDAEEGEDKSALELNAAGLDSGFLKHVIETQILNRHKTRIKDWDGTKGHMCQSCHETFLSETGLETHRNRRIHHILFYCRYCKRDLSFFNKCRLLQHLRNHRATPTVSSLQNCIMITILNESNYLHFKYEDCTSSSDDEEATSSHVNVGGGGGGGGNSSSNGTGSASKRLKPSRFRRIARPSITGEESDNSPPPSFSRQIVAPPQLSSPPPSAENSTMAIVATLNNSDGAAALATDNHAVAEIKYNGLSASGGDYSQSNTCQGQVVKSPGNITSVTLPSVAANMKASIATLEKESSTAADSSDSPQIRIRNLSQITVSVNDDEDNNENPQGDDLGEEKFDIAPTLQSQTISLGGSPVSAPNSEKSISPPVMVATKKEYRCYKCDKIYRNASELFKHLEEAERVGLSSRSLHRCPTDDIPSWSQCQYVFHTKVFHEKSVPFMCPGCGQESSDYNSLLEHVTNDCFYLSQRARYMCAATVSKCSFSDRKSVKTEPEIIDHLKKEHSRSVLQCLQCTQGFATDNWLLKHLSEAHGTHFDEAKGASEREALINKTTRPLTQCLICNILFPNGPTYLQHVYLNFHMHICHAKMLECQNCLAVFETQDEILNHRKENYPCRKLDPFRMKISDGSVEKEVQNVGGGAPAVAASMASNSIKVAVVANPAAVQRPSQQSHLLKTTSQNATPKSQGGANMVAVITTTATTCANGAQPPILSPKVPAQPTSKLVHQKQSANPETNSSHKISSNPSPHHGNNDQNVSTVTPTSSRIVAKKTIFDDLLSCQFCERLVVFSSLRKHEDQCCGLSTVDPGFCLTCKQYFGDKTNLARHGVVHIQEGLPICLFCNNRHIRPTHPKSTTPSAHENLYALKKHLYSNHTSKIVQFPFKCSICSAWCADKRACEFHIKDHQFKIRVKAEESHPSPIDISQDELRKMVKVRRKGVDPKKKAVTKTIEVYYCPVCKNREFALESGLARHLKLVHQKNPKSLNLSLLKKASTARRFVVKAPESVSSVLGMGLQPHKDKPLLRSITSGVGVGMVKSGVCSSTLKGRPSVTTVVASTGGNGVTVSSTSGGNTFTSRFSSSIVLRKRLVSAAASATTAGRKLGAPGGVHPQRQLPNTRQRASTITTPVARSASNNAKPPSNFLQTRSTFSKTCRKKDGTITCLKCPAFSCKSENEFYDHVKWNHVWPDSEIQKLKFGNKLEEPSEYWCPECNTMFVAKPSLVRHLKFAHDYISGVEEYMQKIGYDGKKPLKPHQCDVCYFQCADDREHQQHIRTHGMAFLRLRQQRKIAITNSK